jgi:hypothetical protein
VNKLIVIYLILLLIAVVLLGASICYNFINLSSPDAKLAACCALVGVLGGVTHCLRAFYLHHCMLKDWQADWAPWYFIRPVVSGVMGFVSMLFIKAGLLAFSSTTDVQVENRTVLYLAVAFLAGYNVQNFLKKLEEVSESLLGVKRKTPPD